jgi:hypothetical protein
MKKTNIRIQRYTQADASSPGAACEDGEFRWEMSIEPDDRAWILFVPTPKACAEGAEPMLCVRVGDASLEGEGSDCAYAAQGSPEHLAYLAAMRPLELGEGDPVGR